MRKPVLFALAAVFLLAQSSPTPCPIRQPTSAAVVFSEPGFPAADSASPSPQQFVRHAARSSTGRRRPPSRCPGRARHPPSGPSLRLRLSRRSLARHQAVPRPRRQSARPRRTPFTRAAYRDSSGWHLRDYSVRFIRPLMIDQYQETPGSDGLQFQPNPDIPLQLSAFAWKRAFSPVIRLSAVDLYHRGGAAGSIDARLDSLAWGIKDGRKLSAPGPSGRPLPQRFRRRTLDFRERGTLARILRQRRHSCNPLPAGHCKAPRNSPCAPRCRSTSTASP